LGSLGASDQQAGRHESAFGSDRVAIAVADGRHGGDGGSTPIRYIANTMAALNTRCIEGRGLDAAVLVLRVSRAAP
jgi:hypothetical protein